MHLIFVPTCSLRFYECRELDTVWEECINKEIHDIVHLQAIREAPEPSICKPLL